MGFFDDIFNFFDDAWDVVDDVAGSLFGGEDNILSWGDVGGIIKTGAQIGSSLLRNQSSGVGGGGGLPITKSSTNRVGPIQTKAMGSATTPQGLTSVQPDTIEAEWRDRMRRFIQLRTTVGE